MSSIFRVPDYAEMLEMVRRYEALREYHEQGSKAEARRARRYQQRVEKQQAIQEEKLRVREANRLKAVAAARAKGEARRKAVEEAAKAARTRCMHEKTRQRCSRIDWDGLIEDPEVVVRQLGWERNQTALRMRETGMKLWEIGERMGVTGGRAGQMVAKARRTRKVSPVEQYQDWHAQGMSAWLQPKPLKRLRRSLDAFIYPPDDEWFPARCA